MSKNSIYNPPGQSKLNYRIKTHSSFFNDMICNLRRQEAILQDGSKTRPLINMRIRDKDDPVIAMLDSWAMALDILTFYQERIANEGYIETATERLSIVELTRTVGYELFYGQGATVYLAFNVDDTQPAPETVDVPAGTQITGIPTDMDQIPPVFETKEDFTARLSFNALTMAELEQKEAVLKKSALSATVSGLDVYLNPGNKILIKGADNYQMVALDQLDHDAVLGNTSFQWSQPLEMDIASPKIYLQKEKISLFGSQAPKWSQMSTEAKLLALYSDTLGYSSYIDIDTLTQETKDTIEYVESLTQWPDFNTSGSSIDLDSSYDSIWTGSHKWVLISQPDDSKIELYSIEDITEVYRSDFNISAKVTRITLDRDVADFDPAKAYVFIFGSQLELAAEEDILPISNSIEIEGKQSFLVPSMTVLITGEGTDDQQLSEFAVIKEVETSDTTTYLTFEEDIQNIYVRSSVSINANIIKAVQGETIEEEILGSGDAASANQSFVLKQKPVISSQDSDSDINIWVNGVKWNRVDSLYWYGSEDRVYMIHADCDENTSVIFGDGKNGARLPTGIDNIKATYRICENIGKPIIDNSIQILAACPIGISEVSNPVGPTDYKQPETLEHALISVTVKGGTHDRIVSVGDYEKFASSFPGIDKAAAVKFKQNKEPIIHITVAGTSGSQVLQDSEIYQNLLQGLKEIRASNSQILIDSYTPVYLGVQADIFFDSLYKSQDVENRVKEALIDSFSFDKQEIGKDIRRSDVIAAVQEVEGVVYVKIQKFFDSETGLDIDSAANRKAYWNYEENKPEPAKTVFFDSEKSSIILNLT